MKLLMICLLAATMYASAAVNGQTVSFSKKNASISDIFIEIKKQTGYNFLYKDALLRFSRPVNIAVSNMPVGKALDLTFKDQPLTYNIVDKTIIIKEDPQKKLLLGVPVIVTGTVLDELGKPLAGASILVKGQTRGTSTNAKGEFTIDVAPDAVLEVSSVGYEPQQVNVDKRETLTIVLKASQGSLDEVIAIGYGRTTRGKNVTSVSTLKPDAITNLGAASVGDGLAGRVPGLIVSASGGGPGKKPTISIRGGGTPVYVIDNIISSEAQFQTLNINDIENISFLKDGPATAIYGVAAGNGLVLVTTKRGTKGKMNVNYNFTRSISQNTYLPEKLNAYEYVTLQNQVAAAEGAAPVFQDADVQKYKDHSDPLNFQDNDWQGLTLKRYAPQSQHNLSMSGGNEQMQYFASLGYLDQGSLYKFDTKWLKRYNYRLHVTGNFEKIGLKTTIGLYGVNEINRDVLSAYAPSQNYNVWGHIQNRSPIDKAYADLAHTKYANQGDHPIVEIDPRSGYLKNEGRDINGLLEVQWSVPGVKGLSFKGNGNLRQSQSFIRGWNVTAPQYAIGSDVPSQPASAPSLSVTATTGYNYVLQGFGDYTRTFGDHSLSVMGGYEEAYGFGESVNASRNSYVFLLDQLFAGPVGTSRNSGSSSENVRNAWLGRLNYDYKGKYFFEGAFRYDGSDLFPEGKRKGFFPGGVLGWVISKEPFMKALDNSNIINYLRGRVSYGSVGQIERNGAGDPVIGYFSYVPGYGSGSGYVVGGVLQPSLNPPAIPSPDITWYTQQSFNTGLDFATLNNRLSGSVDYFYLRNTGYLASLSASLYTDPLGTALPFRLSNGAFRRAGFDFGLKYSDHAGKLKYTVGANFTRFDQLWEVNANEDSATLKNPYMTSYHQTGFLTTGLYALGLYQNATDIINNPRKRNTTLAPGDIMYQDVNGDGKIDNDDFRRIGKNGFPRVNYGFNADLSYEGWFLNMLWQGSGKRSVYLGDVFQGNSASSIRYVFQTEDRWSASNPGAQYPRLLSSGGVNGSNNDGSSDFWVINAGYLRLKAVQLGYNFKDLLAKRLRFVSDLRITLSGTNLVTFSKLLDYGLDPETGSNNNYDYPVQRTYALSINLGF
ncbi:TonB-dependent receptor [Niabella drilacis]|uniref:TonB-dependent receptor n=1 Tax=Niabella drilacis (strain DSM 25811 / CCM 8410 / CCUG 62505 / LMG 26954 / E90) TaxID=1285928 RepID=UPI0015A1AB9B|nr:TonB-dependent receptor [Niabella drilacis]